MAEYEPDDSRIVTNNPCGAVDNRELGEELLRERDEPGTSGQDGSGDAGRAPADGESRDQKGDEDKLGSRAVPFEAEDGSAADKSKPRPAGQ